MVKIHVMNLENVIVKKDTLEQNVLKASTNSLYIRPAILPDFSFAIGKRVRFAVGKRHG